MKALYRPGDQLQTSFEVAPSDWAIFHGETVHEVCSTYALAREAEWACRQFVLQMRDDHEEGLGNGLTIEHRSPALTGEVVVVVATLVNVTGSSVNCTWEARVEDRLVACGACGQTLWPREKIASHWQSFVRKP